MTVWLLIVIIAVVFIGLGLVIDYIAKKKSLQLDPEEGIKNASSSERVYKELHLKQMYDDLNKPNQ